MSGISYDPPLEDLAIFDPSVFIYDQNLSSTTSGGSFLNFPIAQGTETFIDLISNGTATLTTATVSTNITATTGTNTNVITGTSLVLTSGATINTLNALDWTGNIKTVNTGANATHYLNFSDNSATGQGHPQKTAGISCNPSTNTITATTFVGAVTGASSLVTVVNNNTDATNFIPFVNSAGAVSLRIDNTTAPLLTYNPSSGIVTASSFSGSLSGNASSSTAIALTSDNTSGNYYIPFSKTTASATSSLFLDDTTSALTYNPFTHSLSASSFIGNASSASAISLTSDNTSGTYFIPFSKTVSSVSILYVDNTTTPLQYNPSTSTVIATTFNGNANTASTSSAVALTSDDTAGSYFIPFAKTVSGSSPLFVDNSVTPLSYNPSTSRLACNEFSGDLLGNSTTSTTSTTSNNVATANDTSATSYNLIFCAGASASTPLLVDSVVSPLTYVPSTGLLTTTLIASEILSTTTTSTATFAGTTLSVSVANRTYTNFTINFTGTVNTVTTLNLTGSRNNGRYYVAIRNNGTLATSFLTGLGANILTKYSATVVVPASSSAFMMINTITLNGVTTTIVGIDLLT